MIPDNLSKCAKKEASEVLDTQDASKNLVKWNA